MTVPSYTAETLANYMRTVIGPLADVLGWSEPTHYTEPVTETMLALDIDDLADVTARRDLQRLRAVARREVWRSVAGATAGNYRFTTDNQAMDRQQVYAHAVSEQRRAEMDCLRLGIGFAVAATITRVAYSGEVR